MFFTELQKRPAIEDILPNCVYTIMSNGDELYQNKSQVDYYPTLVISRASYECIIRKGASSKYTNLIELLGLENPRRRQKYYYSSEGVVTQEDARSPLELLPVAVKRFDRPQTKISGIDQYLAMRSLEKAGALCAPTLAATRYCLVSKWINGTLAYEVNTTYHTEYLKHLEKLIEELARLGKWKKEWLLDKITDNYFVNNLSDNNPLNWFIAIDPIIANHHSYSA
jgi:hypothetical protein